MTSKVLARVALKSAVASLEKRVCTLAAPTLRKLASSAFFQVLNTASRSPSIWSPGLISTVVCAAAGSSAAAKPRPSRHCVIDVGVGMMSLRSRRKLFIKAVQEPRFTGVHR